jgi:hypothetical protein
VVDGPVSKYSPAIDELAVDRPEHTRIVGTDAMVAHHEIVATLECSRAVVANIGVLRRDVRLGDFAAVDIYDAAANLYSLSRKSDDALDEGLGMIHRIPEHDDVAAVDGLEAVNEFIDEDALLIGEERRHAGTFDFNGLIEKNDDDQGETDGNEKIAGPDAYFVTKQVVRRSACAFCRRARGRFGSQRRCCGGSCVALRRGTVVLVVEHLVLPFSYNMRTGF